jgi:phosphoribosylanthranilate isomerase
MRPGLDVRAEAARYADAAGILLDAFGETARGGTGTSFDWSRIPSGLGQPVILAGGLAPDNVAQAIRVAKPHAVDVSSGVEASKGIKDHAKIRAFIQAVRSVT